MHRGDSVWRMDCSFLPHNLTSLANNQFAKCNKGCKNRDSNPFPNLLKPL